MKISERELERLPKYLKILRQEAAHGVEYISSAKLAKLIDMNEQVVRKDLQLATKNEGIPRVGRDVKVLISELEEFLGYNKPLNAIVIGCGNLGISLLCYNVLKNMGLNIVCAFDNDPNKIGKVFNQKEVMSTSRLEEVVKNNDIEIAIITTTSSGAKEASELAAKAHVKGIWNFSNAHINVKGIEVIDVDFSSSLAILTHKIRHNRNH